jgi:hypothetical protein
LFFESFLYFAYLFCRELIQKHSPKPIDALYLLKKNK